MHLHQDHLGDSFVSTDGPGAQKAGIAYYPCGGTLGTDRKYTGQRLDTSDLYYYDAGIGKFISADPASKALDDRPQGILEGCPALRLALS